MGKKTQNLRSLLKQGINVHDFQELTTKTELLHYLEQHQKISIRFDREKEIEDLPFYTLELGQNDFSEQVEEIVAQAKQLNCTLLVSNGHQYDEIQICNFVGKMAAGDRFFIELSTKKVPLRRMYDGKTTVVEGSFLDNVQKFHFVRKEENPIEKKSLEQIVLFLMQLNLEDCYIEGTLYPKPVGMLHQPIVAWQIREEKTYGR